VISNEEQVFALGIMKRSYELYRMDKIAKKDKRKESTQLNCYI